jgi:hypothetical protein
VVAAGGGISERRQRMRRRTQPMMSMIQKVSMGVSKPAATTNQYCVSESLSIDVPREGYVDQTDGRNIVDAVIFYTQRPVSVLSSVTNTSDCFFFLR